VTTGELLAHVPGVTKDQLYYFEAKGFLHPRKVSAGKIERNDYTEEDLKMVKAISKYYQQGFPPKVAFQKAMAEQKTPPLPLR
jgi:DNA-binding transcriptional MerR regulator